MRGYKKEQFKICTDEFDLDITHICKGCNNGWTTTIKWSGGFLNNMTLQYYDYCDKCIDINGPTNDPA